MSESAAPEFHFTAIGILRDGGGEYRQQSPRQGALAENTGVIELYPGRNFETAAADLTGVERIWVLYVFDRNSNWKPKVQPPVGSRRIGVFATRSPHRPNPLGLSAVRLLKVEGLKLYIAGHDLLNGTAILDIKPYLSEADSFPDSRLEWRDEVAFSRRKLIFSEAAEVRLDWLEAHDGPDLRAVAEAQLALRELDPKRQRLSVEDGGMMILAFRTWRIVFAADETSVTVTDIRSGYGADELADGAPDKYGDKELHRAFRREFLI